MMVEEVGIGGDLGALGGGAGAGVDGRWGVVGMGVAGSVAVETVEMLVAAAVAVDGCQTFSPWPDETWHLCGGEGREGGRGGGEGGREGGGKGEEV